MRRLPHPIPRRAAGEPPDLPDARRRDQEQRHAAAETAGEARCPRCRALLVARMGRHGPCIPCRCPGWGGSRK